MRTLLGMPRMHRRYRPMIGKQNYIHISTAVSVHGIISLHQARAIFIRSLSYMLVEECSIAKNAMHAKEPSVSHLHTHSKLSQRYVFARMFCPQTRAPRCSAVTSDLLSTRGFPIN